MELDEALGRLGDWGRWQVLYFLMLSMACMFPASWHMFAIVFIGTTLAMLSVRSDWHRVSVAEWLACWTQAQKGPGSNRSRDAVA